MLITNTTFTPNARRVAEQRPLILRLRDMEDIRRWIENECLDGQDWREIPEQIEIAPGILRSEV